MNLQKRFNELSQEKRKRIQKILEEYKDSPCYKTPHEKQIESEVTQLRAENERLKAELAEAKKDADIFQWLQDNHVRAQAFF